MDSSILGLLLLLAFSMFLVWLVSTTVRNQRRQPSPNREENWGGQDPAISVLQDPLHQFHYLNNPADPPIQATEFPIAFDTNRENSWGFTDAATSGIGSDSGGFSGSNDAALGALGDSAAGSLNSDS
jgi:hypothetical protein